MTDPTDEELLAALQRGEEWALDRLFRTHYTYLCQVVFRVLPDRNTAEDLVQEVFLAVWRKRDTIRVEQSVHAYFRRAAVNRTLNYIRDQKLIVDDETALPADLSASEAGIVQQLEAAELAQEIEAAIAALPERCRLIFGLSRFEQLSNKAIAEELGLSIKTVENQMTRALKLLRDRLTPFFFWWFCLLTSTLELIVSQPTCTTWG